MPQPVGIAARNRTKTVSPNLTVKETPLKPSMGQASATPALGRWEQGFKVILGYRESSRPT